MVRRLRITSVIAARRRANAVVGVLVTLGCQLGAYDKLRGETPRPNDTVYICENFKECGCNEYLPKKGYDPRRDRRECSNGSPMTRPVKFKDVR